MLNRVADVMERSTGITAAVEEILKDGENRECILFGNEGKPKAILYKEHVKQVIDELGFYDGCKRLAEIATERMTEDLDGIVDVISDWELARPHLINCLRKTTLKSVQVTQTFLDVEQYCRLEFDKASIVVTEGLLDKWGITPNEMFEAACENQTYCIRGLVEITTGIKLPKEEEVTFVAGGDRPYGAGIICDSGTLKIIRDYIGTDYYIIPSSIHEALVLREDFTDNVQDLKELLRSVNDNEVAEEERLSYSVYKYTENDGLRIVA